MREDCGYTGGEGIYAVGAVSSREMWACESDIFSIF